MEKLRKEELSGSVAKSVSILFHPLFMPLYGLVIIFSTPTLFGYLPMGVKRIIFFIVLINNVFLPLSLLPYLKYRNFITSWTMDNKKERMLPLFIATILYAATSYIITRYPVPSFIKTFFTGVFAISMALTVINQWWKISIHSAAVGSVLSMVVILSVKMNSAILWPLMIVIVGAGLTLSARLKLNAHSPSEVWSGFFLGFTGLGAIMWLF